MYWTIDTMLDGSLPPRVGERLAGRDFPALAAAVGVRVDDDEAELVGERATWVLEKNPDRSRCTGAGRPGSPGAPRRCWARTRTSGCAGFDPRVRDLHERGRRGVRGRARAGTRTRRRTAEASIAARALVLFFMGCVSPSRRFRLRRRCLRSCKPAAARPQRGRSGLTTTAAGEAGG